MNLKIEINDLPEFNNSLQITVTLQRDENGKVGENVKVFPDSVPSCNTEEEMKEETKKEDVKKRGKKSKISVEGDDTGAKVSSISEASKPQCVLSTDSIPKPSESKPSAPRKSKFSGNMMGLEF